MIFVKNFSPISTAERCFCSLQGTVTREKSPSTSSAVAHSEQSGYWSKQANTETLTEAASGGYGTHRQPSKPGNILGSKVLLRWYGVHGADTRVLTLLFQALVLFSAHYQMLNIENLEVPRTCNCQSVQCSVCCIIAIVATAGRCTCKGGVSGQEKVVHLAPDGPETIAVTGSWQCDGHRLLLPSSSVQIFLKEIQMQVLW